MVASVNEATSAEGRQDQAGQGHPELPVLVWIRLMRVYQKLHQQATVNMQRNGLSLSRFDVLNHAGVREGRTQQELADALFVTKGNICQLLDALEADGLLMRQRAGRSKRIYLTERGRALRSRLLTLHEAEIAARFEGLSRPEQETLFALLGKLDRSLTQSSRSR